MNFYDLGVFDALIKLGFSKEALERWQLSDAERQKLIMEDVARESAALRASRSNPQLSAQRSLQRSMAVDPWGDTVAVHAPTGATPMPRAPSVPEPWLLDPKARGALIRQQAEHFAAQLRQPSNPSMHLPAATPAATPAAAPAAAAAAAPEAAVEAVTKRTVLPKITPPSAASVPSGAMARLKSLLRLAPKG